MNILRIILIILEMIVYGYLVFAVIYLAIFGFASLFKKNLPEIKQDKKRKFAVMIPGYKEDLVIVDVAKDALEQNYPKDLFEVIVIADSIKPETLDALRHLPIRVEVVVFEVSKKSKALNKCMAAIGDDFDVAMILDADNIMAPDVLQKINEAFNRGFLAVQGHRTAKNTNTNFAILDAISEEINNTIFRKGHRVLGLSSALIGSGMAIDYKIYKAFMSEIDSVGEDKELEMRLLKNGYTIEYAEDAYVYDEKTSQSKVFVNQRRRWIAAQLLHFRDYFIPGFIHLLKTGNIDFFDKVLQMIQPPRILLSGILFLLTFSSSIIYFFDIQIISKYFILNFYYWLTLLIITGIILLVSVPRRLYNVRTYKALRSLPIGFVLMFISLFKVKGAGSRFIHTTHSHTGTIRKNGK
ncbi:MAG: glycosyltransferase family 2 protein [Bacteroidales bacterium]|nr:glycosyltransferase family 2 protein [Bacteroidales bacterium]